MFKIRLSKLVFSVLLIQQLTFSIQPAVCQPFTSSGTRYGMNCEAPAYTESAYTDVCMEAWWGGSPTSLGPNGYPNYSTTNWAGVQLFFSNFGDNGGGIYNFYGEGIFDVSGSYSYVQNSQKTYVNSQGVTITTAQFLIGAPAPQAGGYYLAQGIPLQWINISNINPNGDPKNWPNNFHLIRPGYPAWKEGDSFYPVTANSFPIFTTEFLKSFAPFCCIRFMDWMNTNGNTGLNWGANGIANTGSFSWAQRPKLNYFQSSPAINSAVAYENMIALCNATNCDMWMNVPLQATDDWKAGFANLVTKDPVYHLNPWLHVYYEHCNEMWNWSFIAWQLVDQWAQADFGSDGKGAWFDHGEEMGKLLMSDVDVMQPIFRSISPDFGRPIAAGQWWDTSSYCAGMLYYIQNNYGPPKNYIYAIAGAPYFGSDPNEFTGGDLTSMQANVNLAKQYDVKVCAYEGGQGLNSTPQSTFDANFAYQETPAMATQYYNFAQMWQQNGGDLCNFFTNSGVWSQFGYWGHLPLARYIDNLSDPACTRFNAAASIASVCNCGNAEPAQTSGGGSSSSSSGSNSNTGSNSSGNNSPSGTNSSGSSQPGNNAGNNRWLPYGNPYGAHGALGSPAGVPWMGSGGQ